MIENNVENSEGYLNVPVEATAFLVAVAAFAVLLLVIVMYLNKKFRLFNVNVEPLTDAIEISSNPVQSYPLNIKLKSQLSDSYIISQPESSSESEDDILKRLKQISGNSNKGISSQRHQYESQHPEPLSMSMRGYSLDHSPRHIQPQRQYSQQYSKLQQMHQQRSFDMGLTHPLHLSHQHSIPENTNSPLRNQNVVSSNISKPYFNSSASASISSSHFSGSLGMRPLRVTTIRNIEDSSGSTSMGKRRSHLRGLNRATTLGGRSSSDANDMISLAEKGKICGGSSASSTSSSADVDDLHRHHPGRLANLSHSAFHQSVTQPHQLLRSNSDSHHPSNSHANPLHHPPLQRSISRDRDSRELNPSMRPHPVMIPSSYPSASGSQNNYRRMMLPPRTKSVDSESPPPSEQGMSTYGDSIADQDDHIFEVEELSMTEGELGLIETRRITSAALKCGSIEVAFDYEAAAKKMTAHIIQGRGIPTKDAGGANNTQVRIVLLPSRKQKHKTKVRQGENPQYLESFVFSKINPEDVSSLGIRIRLYGCERMRRERLLGEYVLAFASLHLELETTLWLELEPKYHLSWDSRSDTGSLARSDSASSTQSIQNGLPELLVGLAYNGTTGRLTVEIIKGSHFRNLAAGRAPDSYIKLVLVGCNGQEMGRAKSSLRRAQSNPLFKETFMFQVALFQISEVTLLISIYGRKGVTRRELLGWFALGYNSSGDEETSHWEDMCDAQGDQMCRWHVLLQS